MERNNWADQPFFVPARAPMRALQVSQSAPAPAGAELLVEPRLTNHRIKEVLFVDPSLELQRTVQSILKPVAAVHTCSTFEDACSRLISSPPDLLVTSVRLHAHNGVHLVYLAARNARTRSIVHLTSVDFGLAREVEAAGAFVVREPFLVVALESIVTANLPLSDRRDPVSGDRRLMPRGGRRCTDSQNDAARKPVSVRTRLIAQASPSHH
jgi:DNA-binding response OmpR family regulator